jgi:hypothetical protein
VGHLCWPSISHGEQNGNTNASVFPPTKMDLYIHPCQMSREKIDPGGITQNAKAHFSKYFISKHQTEKCSK